MQSMSYDLAIISYQGGQCGLSLCSRSTPHYHCRLCGFGTSQVGNAVSHGRLCASIDLPQKDFPNIAASSDTLYCSATQTFPYFPQASQSASSSSKMITTQQSTMYNFVIPPQNAQYGGLYGPQTVFPNSNLFSPSGFTNYTQLDSTWMAQSRILSANVIPASTSPTDAGVSSSSSCCKTENVPFGMTSPLTDAFKVSSKEQQSQNWYSSSQNVVQQKYPDSTASSCSIGLLFLEQNKEADECIDVDDICLATKIKEPIRSSCMEDDNKADDSLSSSNASDIVVEESESDVSEESHITIRCLVCDSPPASIKLSAITETAPLTITSKMSVLAKVSAILDEFCTKEASICCKCLELVNIVDALECKLLGAMEELKKIRKLGKEGRETETLCKTEVDKSLICQTCDKIFSNSAYLAKHKQHHTKSFSHCCEFCGKGFTGLQKLENHILLHSKTLKFQCEQCGNQFLEKQSLENHMKQHNQDGLFHCPICKKGFTQGSTLKSHMISHEGMFYICHYCGRRVKTYSNLVVHIKICSGDLKYTCKQCDKRYPLKSLLLKHVSCKHKSKFKFKCSSCPKGFWKKSDLLSHSMTHSDEKPHKCSTCGQCYKSKKNLKHHSKIHESRTNLKCSACGKEFTRADALADHMNQHTGRKPYQCQTCWKKFSNRINFGVHIKGHTDLKKASTCPVCSKVVMKGLKEHMQVHSNDKPFACTSCPTRFSFKNSMIKHVRLKHGICKENKLF